jgi:predicted GNAT family N-acyltransferase
MTEYEVRRLDWDAAFDDAYDVRREVFIDEQDVPEEIELDGKDADAIHFVAYDSDDTPVGTARLRVVDDATGKAERVAVRAANRGHGLGEQLMKDLEREAEDRGCSRILLHAQTRVEGFYSGLGYETISDVFEEAGIPHVEMVKELDD